VIYIKDSLRSEKRILYIIDDYTRIYFVFTFLNDKLDFIIKCLKAIIVAGLKSGGSQVTSSQVTSWSRGTTLVTTLTLFF